MTIPDRPPVFCDICSMELNPGRGDFYLVRIEAVADPSPPRVTEEDLAKDVTAEIGRLLDRMRDMTEQELRDQVHRRVVLNLCIPCYTRWIENPTHS
jgi:hypothetical protein